MSDIWHITNKNKGTTDIPEEENMVVLDGVMGHSCLWYGGEEPEPIFWENVKRWCYLDELILENERTRKALELAITGLKNCKTRDHIGAVCRTPEYVDKILEQIKTIIKGGDND